MHAGDANMLSDVPTSDTLAFVLSCLSGESHRRILEVGCGSGELAAELQRVGHTVVALDSDEASVEACLRKDIHAVHTVWPEFEDAPFDAILFTRSLHHIHPLNLAIKQAVRLLRPNGVLIVEDFAYSDVSSPEIAWFTSVLKLLSTCGLLEESADVFAIRVLRSNGDPAVWHADHDHELHAASTMEDAIREHFALRSAESSPYFYRYLVPVLRMNERSQACLKCVVESERTLIRTGAIRALGRRWVAHHRPK